MDTTGYEDIRDQIQTGDLLAMGGAGPISLAIRWWTRSIFSHVGLLIRLAEVGVERVFLLHATAATGVVLLPVSRYLSSAQGRAWWVPLNHSMALARNASYQNDLLRFAFAQLGKSYDTLGIVHFLLPFIHPAEAEWFCSELAAASYQAAGLPMDTFVSPGQLASNPIFANPKEIT